MAKCLIQVVVKAIKVQMRLRKFNTEKDKYMDKLDETKCQLETLA